MGELKIFCRDCKGNQICDCGIQRSKCRECRPLSWAKDILRQHKRRALKENYKPPAITAEELLKLPRDVCWFCGGLLVELKYCLHHDHSTGVVYGYSHTECNKIEGLVKSSTVLNLENLFKKLTSISNGQEN